MPVYKLEPNSVPTFWDLIKPGLILGKNISGVDGSADFANTVLERALAGYCVIWLLFEEGEVKGDNYVGFAVTILSTDAFSKHTDMVLYYGYTYRPPSPQLKQEAIIKAMKYAKSNRCNRIVAYTDIPGMERVLDNLFGPAAKKRTMFYVNTEDY